jgi:integrase
MATLPSGDRPEESTNGRSSDCTTATPAPRGLDDEQTLADSEQTLAESDQTSGEREQTSADSDQAASNQLCRLAAQAGVRRRFAPHQLRHAHAIEIDTMEELACGCRRGRHSPRRLRGKSSR